LNSIRESASSFPGPERSVYRKQARYDIFTETTSAKSDERKFSIQVLLSTSDRAETRRGIGPITCFTAVAVPSSRVDEVYPIFVYGFPI
jgi:hypothetical protein